MGTERSRGPQPAVPYVLAGAAAVLLGLAALVATTMPYRGWDPYFYGDWARLIALRGGFHFPAIGATHLHRPLFYVLEGELWRLVGYHMAVGRLLSLAFTVGLVVALAMAVPGSSHRRLRMAVTAVVVMAITPVLVHASDGLTDIPVAAMLALLPLVAWRRGPGVSRTILLVAVACLAVLAKPSGIVGGIAFAFAEAVGPREGLRARLQSTTVPVVGGVLLGLLYDWSQARHVGWGLQAFLQSGLGAGIWAQKAAAARPDAIYGWDWLGSALHVVLVFAVAYALLRVATLSHRVAALAATGVTWLWAFLGPTFGSHAFSPGLSTFGIATYVLAACLPLAALARADGAPDRLHLARMLIWATPGIVVWAEYSAYDIRLASSAWPPLVFLIAGALVPVLTGAASRHPALVAVPTAAIVALALNGAFDIDGLGHAGWQQYRSHGIRGLGDSRFMENVALGNFQKELDTLRAESSMKDRIIGDDGRLDYFFPGRVRYTYPRTCTDVSGYRALVLLGSDESIAQQQASGAPTATTFWDGCSTPRLTVARRQPGDFTVWVTGTPRSQGSCSAPPPPSGLLAIFGERTSEAEADRLRQQAAKFGFTQTQVVQVGCDRYDVLETGVPNEDVGKSIVAEAKRVGMHVRIASLSPG